MRNIVRSLDNPKNKLSISYAFFVVLLIYISVIQTAVENHYPKFFENNLLFFNIIEYFILGIFTIEILIRIIFSEKKVKYIFSFYGLIDLLSIIPGILSLIFTGLDSTVWLRVLKIFRILRILKIIKIFKFLDGITGKLIPYIAISIAIKSVMVIFEANIWWPEVKNINTFITVVGFALAVLMGTKLSVVNNRIYQIEDAICRIVGSLRDMQYNKKVSIADLYNWSSSLEKILKASKKDKKKEIKEMRLLTDKLEECFEEKGFGGPNTAGFHRDVSYLLHRTIAKTPAVYERFLKHIIITYTLTIIFVLPGLTGLIMTLLLVYVLGGMYFLIDDMDNPLDYNESSFIDVRLDALEFYNKELKEKITLL